MNRRQRKKLAKRQPPKIEPAKAEPAKLPAKNYRNYASCLHPIQFNDKKDCITCRYEDGCVFVHKGDRSRMGWGKMKGK